MDNQEPFASMFKTLTGNPPFPWQTALYQRFVAGAIPAVASVPTGLGKTSVIAIWLLAWLNRPEKTSRRLVYVVNRRTVVDQTTKEVSTYRQRVTSLQEDHPLRSIVESLGISTLRGQFADNEEWSADRKATLGISLGKLETPAMVISTAFGASSKTLDTREPLEWRLRLLDRLSRNSSGCARAVALPTGFRKPRAIAIGLITVTHIHLHMPDVISPGLHTNETRLSRRSNSWQSSRSRN